MTLLAIFEIHRVEPNSALLFQVPSAAADDKPQVTPSRAVPSVAWLKQEDVRGRSTPAMCLSDGYDSGAIAASLGRLGIPPAMYTVQAREVDDKAAAGLSWIYRQASYDGQRMFLSGTGADEIISDYGSQGVPFELWQMPPAWSTGHGGPQVLAVLRTGRRSWSCHVLPEDYLAKEESTAGAHGVETRYPFLDRNLVQEFLWLSSDAWAETATSLALALMERMHSTSRDHHAGGRSLERPGNEELSVQGAYPRVPDAWACDLGEEDFQPADHRRTITNCA
eukprot:Skav224773  [mRNA]  locus=scaffold1604:677088:681471:- [translate_table: standard]